MQFDQWSKGMPSELCIMVRNVGGFMLEFFCFDETSCACIHVHTHKFFVHKRQSVPMGADIVDYKIW